MPERGDYRIVWIAGLIFGPLVLVAIELFHPAGFTRDPGMFAYLRSPEAHSPAHHALDYFGPGWWFWLHMIQTPVVCLITLSLMLTNAALARSGRGAFWLSWGARAALFVFLVYYTALDAIGGIGLGRSIEIVNTLATSSQYETMGAITECKDAAGALLPCLSDVQVEGVALVLNQTWVDRWVGGVGSVISQTGSWAILIGAVLTAAAMRAAQGARALGLLGWAALGCLVAAGWFVQVSHACCTGPVGFGFLFLFGALTWIRAVWIGGAGAGAGGGVGAGQAAVDAWQRAGPRKAPEREEEREAAPSEQD